MSATVRISKLEFGDYVSIPSVGARGMVTGIVCDKPRAYNRVTSRWAVTIQEEPDGPETTYALSGDRVAIVEA